MMANQSANALRLRSFYLSLPMTAFVFGAICTGLPLLLHLYLPLVDLPNHIARLYIAETSGMGPLARYYTYSNVLVPNSAVDFLWEGLGHPFGTVRFANLVMVSYAVNMIASAMVLARVVHGRWTTWSAASALLVYSAPFFWGFQNFVWSLPFCLYGIALWLAMERQATWRRLVIFVPFAALLYLMHFFAFGFLAIAVAGRELQTLWAKRDQLRRMIAIRIVLMLPFILPVFYLAFSLHEAPPSPAGTLTAFGGLTTRLSMLVSPLFSPNTNDFPAMNILSIVGLLLLVLVSSRVLSKQGPRLIIHPVMWGPTIAIGLAVGFAPSWLNGVALVEIRAPTLFCFLLIAGTSWQGLDARKAALLMMAFGAVILARGVAMERFSATYEADVRDMLDVTKALPAGARLLPLRAPGKQKDRRLYHLQGLLVAQRDVFVPTLFQGVHALTLREEWHSSAHPASSAIDIRFIQDPAYSAMAPVFAQDWERKFTYALLMDETDLPLIPQLEKVASQGRFTLFRTTP